jgi:glycosyltransferase involved in cell wall biosynthesis
MIESGIKVSVIVPIFNEEWAIYPLFGKLQNLISGSEDLWEIIFVNDGSKDNTQSNLADLANTHGHVKYIQFRRNFGLTQALQAGFDHASGLYVVTLSGNLQNDPKDIPRLLNKLDEGFDVCVGWRTSQDGVLFRDRPANFLNWAISKISGIVLHDYECTLRAYRREMLHGLSMNGQLERYVPVYISWRGGTISEIPVTQHPRNHGHGFRGNRTKRTLKTVFDLILLKYLERFSIRPLYLFGSIAFASITLSLLAFGLMLYFKFIHGESFISTPLPLVATLFFLSGILFGILGIIAEMLSKIFYALNRKTLYEIKTTTGFD